MGRPGEGPRKKLRSVARRWVGGRNQAVIDDGEAEFLRRKGLEPPPDRLSDRPEVWPDMEPSVALFFAMGTQWRWAAVGSGILRVGMDYSALPAVAQASGVEIAPRVFADLRVMEGEVLKAVK